MNDFLEFSAWCAGMFTLAGLVLKALSERFPPSEDAWIETLNRLLPQTQCGQCGYAGCKPYARALSKGERLDLCVPGGSSVAAELSRLTNRPLNTPPKEETQQEVFWIDPARCIGCTKCIQVCPVDCIIGAPKMLHVVLKSECTGCGLCEPACPTLAFQRHPLARLIASSALSRP